MDGYELKVDENMTIEHSYLKWNDVGLENGPRGAEFK